MDAPPPPQPDPSYQTSALETRSIHQAIIKYCQLLNLPFATASHASRIFSAVTFDRCGLRRSPRAATAPSIFIACRESKPKEYMRFATVCALTRTPLDSGLMYLLIVEMSYYRLQGDTRYGRATAMPVLYPPRPELRQIPGKAGNPWLERGAEVAISDGYSTDDGQFLSYCCQRVAQEVEPPEAVIVKDGGQDVAGKGTAGDENAGKTAAGEKKLDEVDLGPAKSDEDADWDLISRDHLVNIEKGTKQDNLQGREAPRPNGSWMGGLRHGLFG